MRVCSSLQHPGAGALLQRAVTVGGNQHRRHLKAKALAHLLHELKPDAVTVEVSSYAIEYRRTAGPELLSRLEPFRREDGSLPRAMHAVVAQLRPPFEYTACEAYADEPRRSAGQLPDLITRNRR